MNIVLTGSVAFDYLMTFPGYFRDHILPEKLSTITLSFLVDSMVRLRGGIAPNIGYTLALLGVRSRLFATVGEDFGEYREWLENAGVDTSWARVIPGVFTASFFANTDRANSQISSFYPGAMGYAAQLTLRELDGPRPDLVVISPNDPIAMDQYVRECRELDLPYLYDPSQQLVRMNADEALRGISAAKAMFVNDYEFALIQKLTGLSAGDITGSMQFVVVTRGEEGASIFAGENEMHIPVVPPVAILDPTGVGDAFRGGFLAGYARELDLVSCAQMGALAATYCLEVRGPQAHHYTPAEFVTRFRRHFEDAGKLDILLTA